MPLIAANPIANKKLPSLDGLRCFSILFVIVGHLSLTHPRLGFLGGGVFGVQFFFVISGFLITSLLMKEKTQTGGVSLKHFYARRILRIFPLAYSFLLVLLLLNTFLRLHIAGAYIGEAAMFIKNIFVHRDWYTSHYWSLSVEEQYYLVFPLFFIRGLRTYLFLCFGFIGLYFARNAYLHLYPATPKEIYSLWDIFLNNNFLSIVIGSLASILFFSGHGKWKVQPLPRMALAGLQLGLLVVAIVTYWHPRFFGLSNMISSAAIAALILSLMIFPYGISHKILNNKAIAYIGKLSFSLYIWQQLFTSHQPWRDAFPYAGSWFFNLPLLALTAWLSYNYIEKPFLRLKERYKSVPDERFFANFQTES